MSNVIEINDSEFESQVIKEDKPVLVYFWATWCGPCRLVTPSIKAIANEYSKRLKVVKLELKDDLDASEKSDLLIKFKVEGVPALRLFKQGELIASHEGAITKKRLQEMLEGKLMLEDKSN